MWLIIQTFILLATAIVILFYTLETYKLRRETQRQIELQIRPFVIFQFTGRTISLKNVGNGTALNVRLDDLALSESQDIKISFSQKIPILLKNEGIEIQPECFRKDRSVGEFFLANIHPEYANQTYHIIIRFQNIEFKSYSVKEEISPNELKILNINEVET
jgi:hypothetical protein